MRCRQGLRSIALCLSRYNHNDLGYAERSRDPGVLILSRKYRAFFRGAADSSDKRRNICE